jgi:preprotein translocase subunit SecA
MPDALIFSRSDELAAGRPYAERLESDPGLHDLAAEYLLANLVRPLRGLVWDAARSLRPILDHVGAAEAAMKSESDANLAKRAMAMRGRLRRYGFNPALTGECFALVSEAASRTLGYRHYPCQYVAGLALLRGCLVEMETGEGKTFAATLPASVVGLSGYPVHVITVNDYLAQRDAEVMGPVYRFLGLSVGSAVQGMERSQKREAYKNSIVYCTNKELAFDYLRDSVIPASRASKLHLKIDRLRGHGTTESEPVLRGLYFAIVDEADSVFVDEARTPLILSTGTGESQESDTLRQALAIAKELKSASDFVIDAGERLCRLTPQGRDRISSLSEDLGGPWLSTRTRDELATQALTATWLFNRDQHYVVAEDKVQIVDEFTGRVMQDRSWERGLHQMIEVKEGCAPTERRETMARLTYQRLFRRYVLLAGMTGTGKEVAREVRSVYGLHVVRVPLHRPSRRSYRPARVWARRADKWNDVADTVQSLTRERSAPVLIGTRSVQASEEISAVLAARGIAHALLNAKQDRGEAEIVAGAGEASQVTVATNMAGRGTDIRLGDGVAENGGMRVILTEFHESQRIDRQLYGRCARQGDPGECIAIVSLEDELFLSNAPRLAAAIRELMRLRGECGAMLLGLLRRRAQSAAERRNARQRIGNLTNDRRMEQMLAFSGRGE